MSERKQTAAELYRQCHFRSEEGFVLASGAVSKDYFDIKALSGNPLLFGKIAGMMLALIPGVGPGDYPQAIFGMESGGISLATGVAMSQFRAFSGFGYVRKSRSSHGRRRTVEGADVKGVAVHLIEDVITSGGSVARGVEALLEEGAACVHVYSAVDRGKITEDGMLTVGEDAVLSAGAGSCRSLYTMDELLTAGKIEDQPEREK